ncbi:hypothetical protein ACR9YC_02085 [Parasphingorhabdus sp. DH2-15]|uniref:hypothetical protein n=1 Tax=Parasphingorhabdus sp. DH2-15 TaxID=3444112 RepID=UPI003F688FE0
MFEQFVKALWRLAGFALLFGKYELTLLHFIDTLFIGSNDTRVSGFDYRIKHLVDVAFNLDGLAFKSIDI